MASSELIISHQNTSPVALGMTSASFDSAQRSGVIRIEPDIEAMRYIARKTGYIDPTAALPPLVLISRDSNDARTVIGRWDDRLPVNQSSPNTGRFFPANHLDRQMPGSANRELFVEVARSIGATALTEVSIGSWEENARHAGDFATGLLLGQRPLNLPPKPSLLGAVSRFLTPESRMNEAIKAVRTDHTMPEPFIVTRLPERPRLV